MYVCFFARKNRRIFIKVGITGVFPNSHFTVISNTNIPTVSGGYDHKTLKCEIHRNFVW
jgi:hypothetical protein